VGCALHIVRWVLTCYAVVLVDFFVKFVLCQVCFVPQKKKWSFCLREHVQKWVGGDRGTADLDVAAIGTWRDGLSCWR
jgi:hypothetical protein